MLFLFIAVVNANCIDSFKFCDNTTDCCYGDCYFGLCPYPNCAPIGSTDVAECCTLTSGPNHKCAAYSCGTIDQHCNTDNDCCYWAMCSDNTCINRPINSKPRFELIILEYNYIYIRFTAGLIQNCGGTGFQSWILTINDEIIDLDFSINYYNFTNLNEDLKYQISIQEVCYQPMFDS